MYDLIGDIHGHAEELEQMLLKLGYIKTGGVYQHPNRQVIFLGDFIDRGPQIKEVLELVRPMVEKGFAKSVMGNHELNALAFHTADPRKQGEFLRPHSDKNIHQHSETLRQVDERTLRSHLQWFRTLPLFLDLGDLRVVHACWDKAEMQKTMLTYENLNKEITETFVSTINEMIQEDINDTQLFCKNRETFIVNFETATENIHIDLNGHYAECKKLLED